MQKTEYLSCHSTSPQDRLDITRLQPAVTCPVPVPFCTVKFPLNVAVSLVVIGAWKMDEIEK